MPVDEYSKTTPFQEENGAVRSMTALHHPICARADASGQQVKVIGLADRQGNSPSLWVINSRGKINLSSADNFTVTDLQFFPPGDEALESIVRGSNPTSGKQYATGGR